MKQTKKKEKNEFVSYASCEDGRGSLERDVTAALVSRPRKDNFLPCLYLILRLLAKVQSSQFSKVNYIPLL